MAHPRDRLGRRPYRPGPGPAGPGERLRREARSTHVRPESPLLPYNRQIDVLSREEIAAWSAAAVGLQDASLSHLKEPRRAS